MSGDPAAVSDVVRGQVVAKLVQLSGIETINDQDNLAADLGIDSLGIAELAVWIEQEFGYTVDDLESLNRVSDLLLAAAGRMISRKNDQVNMPPASWFADTDEAPLAWAEERPSPSSLCSRPEKAGQGAHW